MNLIDALITAAILGLLGMVVYLSWKSLDQDREKREERDEEL